MRLQIRLWKQEKFVDRGPEFSSFLAEMPLRLFMILLALQHLEIKKGDLAGTSASRVCFLSLCFPHQHTKKTKNRTKYRDTPRKNFRPRCKETGVQLKELVPIAHELTCVEKSATDPCMHSFESQPSPGIPQKRRPVASGMSSAPSRPSGHGCGLLCL